MSHHDYQVAKDLWLADTPFYALVMAAMLRADTHNTALLGAVFPRVRAELEARYHAPGGKLATDDQPVRLEVRKVEPGERLRPTCDACGRAWEDQSCGPAHSIIAAETRLHR